MHRTVPISSGRTRFGKDIVTEFWMPRRPSSCAIILCDGCPTVPSKKKVGEFFARKGYWVFHPRYRGTWESGGLFLKYPPQEDVIDVAKGVNMGFQNIYDNKTYYLDISKITIVGASFGGTAAILSLASPFVNTAIAFSPVIDWKAKSKKEPFDYFIKIIHEGFGSAYRTQRGGWEKLKAGNFYSPQKTNQSIDYSRLLIIHAQDDDIVPVAPLVRFAKQKKFMPIILDEGGHFSTSIVTKKELWGKVKEFLK